MTCAPRKQSKTYKVPKRPYEAARLDAELKVGDGVWDMNMDSAGAVRSRHEDIDSIGTAWSVIAGGTWKGTVLALVRAFEEENVWRNFADLLS